MDGARVENEEVLNGSMFLGQLIIIMNPCIPSRAEVLPP